MRGKLLSATWIHDPVDDYVPAKHRRACRYDAFVPQPVAEWSPSLSGDLAGIVADAQLAVASLEADYRMFGRFMRYGERACKRWRRYLELMPQSGCCSISCLHIWFSRGRPR